MNDQVEALHELKALLEEAGKDSRNFKIYDKLGEYYKKEGNLKRAYFCFVHSFYLCEDKEEASRL